MMWPEYLEQNTKCLCGVTILVQTPFCITLAAALHLSECPGK